MQFIYKLALIPRLLEEENWTKEDHDSVARHFLRLQQLVAEGKVVLAGRTLNMDATGFGLVILEVESEMEAKALMNADPTVSEGLMTAELYPYHIALMRGEK